jgi:hypothetical protein
MLRNLSRPANSSLEINLSDKIINIKVGNKSFERVEYFKYLGTPLTNESFIHEEIMSTFK